MSMRDMSIGTIEVRIRPEWEADAKTFTVWPVSDLEGLIREVRMWGFYDGENVSHDASGEFRWLPVPHFEIVVGYDDV